VRVHVSEDDELCSRTHHRSEGGARAWLLPGTRSFWSWILGAACRCPWRRVALAQAPHGLGSHLLRNGLLPVRAWFHLLYLALINDAFESRSGFDNAAGDRKPLRVSLFRLTPFSRPRLRQVPTRLDDSRPAHGWSAVVACFGRGTSASLQNASNGGPAQPRQRYCLLSRPRQRPAASPLRPVLMSSRP
jgi:hypothetical protein